VQTFENFNISPHHCDSIPHNDASRLYNRKDCISADILPFQETRRRFHSSAFALALSTGLSRTSGPTCGEFPMRNFVRFGVPSTIMMTEKSSTFSENGIADLFAPNDLESKPLHALADVLTRNPRLQFRRLLPRRLFSLRNGLKAARDTKHRTDEILDLALHSPSLIRWVVPAFRKDIRWETSLASLGHSGERNGSLSNESQTPRAKRSLQKWKYRDENNV
jgi:hypothetical protein